MRSSASARQVHQGQSYRDGKPAPHPALYVLARLQARSSPARRRRPSRRRSRSVPPSRTRRLSPRRRRRRQPRRIGEGKLDPNDPKHGARKLMGLDVGVFVDGVQASVLRYGDLPSMPSETLEGGAVRYKLVDYVKAIGVAPATHQVDPRPRQRRPHRQRRGQRAPQGAEPLPVPVPLGRHGHADRSLGHRRPQERVRRSRDPQGHHLREEGVADHRREEVLPRRRGRRVLGRGSVRLGRCRQGHAHLRRRQDGRLREAPPARRRARHGRHAPPASASTTSRSSSRASASTRPASRRMDLVAGDDVIAHADAATVRAARARALLHASEAQSRQGSRSRSRVASGRPAASDKDALVSSVQIFKSTKPASRELSAISEDTDLSVQLASNTATSRD